MAPAERAFNVLLALSVLSWAALGLHAAEGAAWTPVRLTIAALHLTVAALLLLRTPLRRHGTPACVLAALPALAVAGWALHVAPPPQDWPPHAQALFVLGAALAIAVFIQLGQSFAILPAVRNIVTAGPFRLVRHPAYLGEWLMVLACGLAEPTPAALAPAALAAPLVVVRILAEERLLLGVASYQDYARRVRWRLVPGVW